MEEDDTIIEEFKVEAAEMFENAEVGLLNIDKGEDFNSNYNSIFRSFHSLKGAAGMFGLNELQSHMHKLESLFEAQKKYGGMKKNQIDYFLQGIDVAKSLLDGVIIDFTHIDVDKFNDDSKTSVKVEKSDNTIAEKNITKKREEHQQHEKIDRKNGVIFIVDDEPDLVDVLEAILEDSNYMIYKFYNGKDALEAFENLKPDVVLSDINMPKFSGIEMLEEIYDISPTTPVVLISGNISKEKMQEALKFGAYSFIDKPFENVSVINICRNAVRKSQASTLLEKSVNYILYQFSELDEYLKSQGKESARVLLKEELQTILEQRKKLKQRD